MLTADPLYKEHSRLLEPWGRLVRLRKSLVAIHECLVGSLCRQSHDYLLVGEMRGGCQ